MKGYLVLHRETGKPISGSRSAIGFYSTIGAAKSARLSQVRWQRHETITDKRELAKFVYKIVEVQIDHMTEIDA